MRPNGRGCTGGWQPALIQRRSYRWPGPAKSQMERVMGIEPTLAAWEAAVLPLNYTRAGGRILEDKLDGRQIGARLSAPVAR